MIEIVRCCPCLAAAKCVTSEGMPLHHLKFCSDSASLSAIAMLKFVRKIWPSCSAAEVCYFSDWLKFDENLGWLTAWDSLLSFGDKQHFTVLCAPMLLSPSCPSNITVRCGTCVQGKPAWQRARQDCRDTDLGCGSHDEAVGEVWRRPRWVSPGQLLLSLVVCGCHSHVCSREGGGHLQQSSDLPALDHLNGWL